MRILRNTPAWLRSLIGTDSPHCIMYCSSPVVFRHTDLPPALGPEIISILPTFLSPLIPELRSPLSSISNATTSFPCFLSDIISSGCFACVQSISGVSSTCSSMPPICSAISAFARIISIVARSEYDAVISPMCGRTSFENSVSIRITSCRSAASSSLIRLLASTTSVGSMNTVFPVADSSCTIP